MSFEILTYGFMHRAIIAGSVIAILCSVIGLFLVLRRYSLFGDALAHSSFGGIALGLFAEIEYTEIASPLIALGIIATALFFVKSIYDKRRLNSLINS